MLNVEMNSFLNYQEIVKEEKRSLEEGQWMSCVLPQGPCAVWSQTITDQL